MKTIVISAFPGTGKSYFHKNCSNGLIVLDSDSSNFSWIEPQVRNPDFPANYIRHIKDNLGIADVIFVSSHKEVRNALDRDGIKYILIVPDLNLKNEYLKRFKDKEFIELLDKNYEFWINEIFNSWCRPRLQILSSGEYISDVLKGNDSILNYQRILES